MIRQLQNRILKIKAHRKNCAKMLGEEIKSLQ